MPTTTAPLTIKKPGDPGYCPSCDRTGLAILVTLFGVIPTQSYARASQYGYDWVTYMEPDSTPFFSDFDKKASKDKKGYLSQRKLADAKSFGSLNCSHYVIRRLRKGFLYVYYPQDKTWDYYKIQTNGRLERMQGDLHHGMGRSDAACARFSATPSNLLLTVDPSQHPEFWIAFSDAPWTKTVRDQVAANPGEFMQHIKIADDLVTFEGDQFIKSTVLGFQDKPLTDTLDREAYPRTPCDSASDTWQALLTHNQPFKASGLILALHDDIGITTQLNFERNAALLDILGENKRYTEDDRARMDTAGLIEQLEYVVGADAFGRMKEHLKDYDKYLKLYRKCRDASVDFDSYSHDYTMWMQHTLTRAYWKLFDPEVPTIGDLLGTITADLFEGSGLTEQEFTQILEPQLSRDVDDPQQLFWRGMAANDKTVLALLANAAVDKTLLDAVKQGDVLKAQVEFLKQFHEAKETAAKLNEASWSRLARVIATRARKLHQADAKAFRRTMRRVQGLTLTQSDLAVLERKVEGTAAEYLAQWREGMSDASGLIRRTPKNTGEMAALSELIVATWKPGEPLQPYFLEAMRQLGVPPEELPASTTVKVTPAEAAPMQLRAIAGLNAGMATLQILSFVESVHALGMDVTQLTQDQKPHIAQMAKDLAATGASLAGAASAGYETAAVLKQMAVGGTKTKEFWLLSLKAGSIGLWAAAFEMVVGVSDARKLWKTGDHLASAAKGSSAFFGGLSSLSGYAALRITASAALKKAAMEAALGTAGELAADAAAAAAVTRGGAVVTSEVPVAAVVLTILSTALWVTSIGLEFWSRYLTTSPLEKWADRSFIGDHSDKYGHAYTRMEVQLDDLLRLLYAIKIEEPSAFGLDNAMTISVPAYGEVSELDIQVESNDRTVGHYIIDGLASGEAPMLQNLARPQPGLVVHAQAEREDGGLTVEIRIGGADSKWLEDAKQMGLRILVPAWGFYDTAHKLIEGMPTAKVHYYPNKAAYPHLWIDGESLEDIIEERENAQ